jgi:ankyrin repeat protein
MDDNMSELHCASIHASAYGNCLGCLKKFIDDSVEVNAIDCDGHTPLTIASTHGHIDYVIALISYGVNVNMKAEYSGWTALHFASVRDHTEIIQILLDNGADKHVQNNNGSTALSLRWDSDDEIGQLIDNYEELPTIKDALDNE